ncbi:MAG: hypothetical protein WCD35_17320 [Mycobacteriales bacterium]
MTRLLVCGLLLAACSAGSPAPPPTSYGGRCSSHDGLPDPVCTPGETDPRVTQKDLRATVCRRGWTASVRPPKEVTHRIKVEVTRAYGIGDVPFSQIELDHLVPLSLGGASTVTNLWPELRTGGADAADKDVVEQRLQDEVCRGRISLRAAQRAIATNWRTAP